MMSTALSGGKHGCFEKTDVSSISVASSLSSFDVDLQSQNWMCKMIEKVN